MLRLVISAYQSHNEDVLSLSQLVPLLTFSFLVIVFVLAFITNAVLILRRRRRNLSVVLGGLTCLAFPFGTALGAVSIFLLTRDEIDPIRLTTRSSERRLAAGLSRTFTLDFASLRR